ncbi:hypothetical protein SAMN05216370_2959 [Pseudomonas peli]|uniref:Uncharacterized protein n=1 Tax=Pseudomonas peli TaxID=592361 RepID=A0AB37Z9E6_9PSED|nr:hypothetical protein SAMN05216370_2959 [Pseudomonas peli]
MLDVKILFTCAPYGQKQSKERSKCSARSELSIFRQEIF